MNIITYNWSVHNGEKVETVVKYCPNCGKVVNFYDTLMRRHNSNGKNIYKFTIFKCEKNHTWNRKEKIFKSYDPKLEIKNRDFPNEAPQNDNEKINLVTHLKNGFNKICININYLDEPVRIDKVLGNQLIDISRNQICSLIKEGKILLNKNTIKNHTAVKEKDTIEIFI
ncbi:S4 domain-containing protein [Weizmannia agrestimuris]|uniref:S4 domain-containing protein n=1 Tax=Weizmannia agrestimuris TaxID=2941342 RepID=UPI0020412CFE|nr:S4 domain-containing protein [Weizmannia agrestimuris]